MENLFEELLAAGEAGIDRLIVERRQESVSLDFKAKPRRDRPDFDRDERKLLARAISGFANSAGGLLVLGVDARKEADDPVDCARAAQPISSIEECCSVAQSLIGEMVQPRHEGVSVAAITSEREAGAGYLLISIARSERRPHRAEAGDGRYYKRAGDGFYAMEHYDIEDAFRREQHAELEPIWRLGNVSTTRGAGGTHHIVSINIGLKNISSAIAKFPFLSVSLAENRFSPSVECGIAWRSTLLDGWYSFDGTAEDVIHPERETMIAQSTISVRDLDQLNLYLGDAPLGIYPIKYWTRIGCENMLLREALSELLPVPWTRP